MSRRNPKNRRAFSVTRGGGRVESGGRPAVARALTRALRAPDSSRDVERELTHRFHSYPARMHPATARCLLEALEPKTVLDPFCGSGTTLVEAQRLGLRTAGVDLNPLGILVARAKTWTVGSKRRRQLERLAVAISEQTIAIGKESRRSGKQPTRFRRPERNRALSGWFAPHVRRELECIAGLIDEVEAEEEAGVLRAVLSAILYKVSKRASDTDATKVEKNVARGAVARLFVERTVSLVNGLGDICDAAPGRRVALPRLVCGDARKLRTLGLGEGAFDAIVTSPPYAGVYDYAQHHDLRFAFLGLDSSRFRKGELGARRRLSRGGRDARAEKALRAWHEDMRLAVAEMARVIRPGGSVIVLIADSLAGNVAVRADEVLVEMAGEELALEGWAWQQRPTFGAAEKRAFSERSKREHLLAFRRR